MPGAFFNLDTVNVVVIHASQKSPDIVKMLSDFAVKFSRFRWFLFHKSCSTTVSNDKIIAFMLDKRRNDLHFVGIMNKSNGMNLSKIINQIDNGKNSLIIKNNIFTG